MYFLHQQAQNIRYHIKTQCLFPEVYFESGCHIMKDYALYVILLAVHQHPVMSLRSASMVILFYYWCFLKGKAS